MPTLGMELSNLVDDYTDQDDDATGIFSEEKKEEIKKKYEIEDDPFNTHERIARIKEIYKNELAMRYDTESCNPDDYLSINTIEHKSSTQQPSKGKNLFAFGIFATFICLVGYKILSESKKLPSFDYFHRLFNTSKTR